MAYALVGTIGAVSTSAANAAVTPAWGTGESRTAGNLLLCWVGMTSSGGQNTPPATPAGWSIAAQQSGVGTAVTATVFYKIAVGSDAAPTIAAGGSNVIWNTMLGEFSGGGNGLDRSGLGTVTTTSPIIATASAADTMSGDLIVSCGSMYYGSAATKTITPTFNNATATAFTSAAVSTTSHYAFSYGISTTNAGADTSTLTFTASGAGNATNVVVSFLAVPITPLLLQDPCENFTAAPWVTAGSPTIAPAHTANGFSFPASSASTVSYNIPSASQSDRLTVGFWVKFNALPPAQQTFLTFRGDAGATLHLALQLFDNGGGQGGVFVNSHGTTLGNTVIATGLNVNTWVYFEFSASLSDTTGYIQIRVNGLPYTTFYAQDTNNSGTKSVFDQVQFIGMSSTSATMLVDDVYIRNDNTFGVGTPPVVSSSTMSVPTSLSITVPTPPRITAGNLLVAILTSSSTVAATWTPAAGFTQIATSAPGGASGSVGVFTKTATVAEPSNYTFGSSVNTALSVVVGQIAGFTVLDGTVAFNPQATSATACTAPSQTPTKTGDLLLAAFTSYNGKYFSNPTGMALTEDAVVNIGSAVFAFNQTLPTTSPTGTISSTQSASSGYNGVSLLLALPVTNGTGSGAITFAGSGVATLIASTTGTGGITFDGHAVTTSNEVGTGNITFDGTGTVTPPHIPFVMVYYVGGPLDGEHQGMQSVGTDPGYTMTINIEPVSYLDPTGADYQPTDTTWAAYQIYATVTAPAFTFTQAPTTLPANGFIPSGWGGVGHPPAAMLMIPGGSATYIGPPGPPPVPPGQDTWTGNWVYAGTEWIWAPFLDVTPDASYLFTYVGEQPSAWSG